MPGVWPDSTPYAEGGRLRPITTIEAYLAQGAGGGAPSMRAFPRDTPPVPICTVPLVSHLSMYDGGISRAARFP